MGKFHRDRILRRIVNLGGFEVVEELTHMLERSVEGILLTHIDHNNLIARRALAEQHSQIALQILLILAKERNDNRHRRWYLTNLRTRGLLKLCDD